MPVQLPGPDYNPLARSLGTLAEARQSSLVPEKLRIDADYRKLKKEMNDWEVASDLVNAGMSIAKGVYGIMEQGAQERAKAKAFEFSQRIEARFMADINNGSMIPVQNPDGTFTVEASAEAKDLLDQYDTEVGTEFGAFAAVATWAKDQGRSNFSQANSWALGQQYAQSRKDRADDHTKNIEYALEEAVKTGDFAPVENVVNEPAWTTPEQKAMVLESSRRQFDYRIRQEAILARVDDGGMGPALEDLAVSGMNDEQKAATETAIIARDKLADARVGEGLDKAITRATESGVPPGMATEAFVATLPEARRQAAREAAAKKVQAVNLEIGEKQFNADRDNPSITYLDTQYRKLKTDPQYTGDEKTRDYLLGRYEGLRASLRAGSEAAGRKEDEGVLTLINRKVELWKAGAANVSGHSITAIINEAENAQRITEGQGNLFRKMLVDYRFPAAKEYYEGMRDTAKSMLGLTKGNAVKADSALTADEANRVSAFAATMSAKLTDKLFEEGGNITPARIGELFENAKTTATAKELAGIQVGWKPFKGQAAAEEEAVAKTKAALDSPAGREAVFSDVNGKTMYLHRDQDAMRDTIEAVSEWERKTLAGRGITVAASAAEAEGLHDITGSKVHTGTDGRQYRFLSEDGRMVPYSRSGPEADWARMPSLAAAPPPSPPPPPSNPRADELAAGRDNFGDAVRSYYADIDRMQAEERRRQESEADERRRKALETLGSGRGAGK